MTLSHRRALAWSFAERYAGFVVALASTLVLARLLTPAQVGVFSLCAALLAVAAIVRDLGVSEYLIQERELTPDKLRSAFGVALLAAWTLALLIWLSRHALAAYFEEPGVAEVLAVMALHFALLPLSSTAFALMNREMAFRRIFWLQTASNSVQAATAVTLALKGHGFLALAWGPVAGVLTQTLLIGFLAPRGSFVRPSFAHARVVLRFGLTYMGSRLIETLAKNFHEPVIAKRFDFEAVGLFSRAYGMVEMFHANVADAVVRVSTPAFARAYREGQPLAEPFARATALFVCVAWPFFGFVALMAEEIIGLMFGPQWLAAAPLASILALAALPAGLYEMVPQMLSATGHVGRRLRMAAWVAPAHIVGVLVASTWGLEAIAAVSFFSGLVMLLLCRVHLRAALGLRLGELLRPSRLSAWVALGTLAAAALAAWPARAAGWPPTLTLLATAAVALLAWWGLVWRLNHPAHEEITRAWRHRQNR
jgi:O-antigen/teichoic acid export membrane protein